MQKSSSKADTRVYVYYDSIKAAWDAILGEMATAERDILQTCRAKDQPYIITTLADDGAPYARLAASALARLRRDIAKADNQIIQKVVQTYAGLPKQTSGGDRDGQIVFALTPDMMADAEAIAEYLSTRSVPRLRYGDKVAYRVPIMLSVIYCGMVIGG